MKSSSLVGVLFFWLVAASTAAVDNEGYDEVTIRPSDIPADAPRFEDYTAEAYSGPNGEPDLRSDPRSRMYRTRLAGWAKSKPNFAGSYILATWGCGTDCSSIAIIDAKTGKIFHPKGVTSNVAVNVHHELLAGGGLWHGAGALKYRTDSRLLVLIGSPEERSERRGISYYVWEQEQLRLVRFVPRPWYKESR
jgi:hypothetical protein